MSTTQLDRQIQDRIQAFLTELSGLVRQSALEAVQAALGGGVAAPARRGRGRPRKNAAASPIAADAPASAAGGKSSAASAASVSARTRGFVAGPLPRSQSFAPAFPPTLPRSGPYPP